METSSTSSTVEVDIEVGRVADRVHGSVVSFHGLEFFINTPSTCCSCSGCCCCCRAPKQILHETRYSQVMKLSLSLICYCHPV